MEFDWIENSAHYYPQKTAVSEVDGRNMSYSQLNSLSNRYANYLQKSLCLSKGDRLGLLSPFSIEVIALFGACQKTGIILVPFNNRLTKTEIDFQINDCGISYLLFDEELKAQAKTLHTHAVQLRSINLKSEDFKRAIIFDDDILFLLYTSGTTGKPKGCIYTYKMLLWNSINTQLRLDLNSTDSTINCMPSFHTGGWNVLITPLLHQGGCIHLMKNFDAKKVLSLLVSTSSSLFMAVPTMLNMMEDEVNEKQIRFPNLRYFIVGGESLPIPTIEYWANKEVIIRQGYGLTEVGPNVTSLHHDFTTSKKGSIGTTNYYIKAKVLNKNMEECQPNEIGELNLAGPCVTPGYWNQKTTSANSKENWFQTGDLVYQDEDGFLFVAGRKKEMFISGGENVYPKEIETSLVQLACINEVAIVGVPHPKWGECGAAFIALKKENKEDALELITAHCAAHLAKYKIPKHFIFLNELPKNATGKIDKKDLTLLFNNPENQQL